MAILGNSVTGAGGGAYTIDNSLRIRSSASAYLSRSIGTTSNNTTWTWSAWIKLGTLPASEAGIFGAGGGAFFNIQWWYSTPGALCIRQYNGSSDVFQLITTQLFRDPSSWYHLVVAYDSTQATASNRIKLYVNGSQVTAFSTASYPSQNQTSYVNTSGNPMQIGRRAYGDNYWDGYIAEQRLVDGQALTPSSFGATNASTGVWQPKAYTGTYGTNGFYQKYSDIATTSASNAGLGKDFSGNGNYFVTNNISVTSGVTYDAMTDSPTPKSSDVCNFAVLNPINGVSSSGTYSDGNLKYIANTDGHGAISTILVNSGKWYWEGTFQNTNQYGIFGVKTGRGNLSYFWTSSGYVYTNAGWTGRTIGTYAIGDVISITVDYPNDVMKLYKNNVYIADLGACSYFGGEPIGCFMGGGNTVNQWTANFGQRPFAYSLPSGFNKLCTYNITTPTIGASSTTLANKYFDALLYTGANPNAIQSVTGLAFQPDFVWIKSRTTGYGHALFDSSRGPNARLQSNTSGAESSSATYMTSFNSGGFTLGVDYGQNAPSEPYVSWNWKEGSTPGFDVVTYTGNATANRAIAHSLGATPAMMIVRNRNLGTYGWATWHKAFSSTEYIYLEGTGGKGTGATQIWASTLPTSSNFYVGNDLGTNNNTYPYIAYLWSEVKGFSAFGSYVGNNSSDGPFIYCGFRPRYVMTKLISANGGDWAIIDTSRNTYNIANTQLWANSTSGDNSTVNCIDILSNGFKIKASGITNFNQSGATYIYMAFAENPFNYSLAR